MFNLDVIRKKATVPRSHWTSTKTELDDDSICIHNTMCYLYIYIYILTFTYKKI